VLRASAAPALRPRNARAERQKVIARGAEIRMDVITPKRQQPAGQRQQESGDDQAAQDLPGLPASMLLYPRRSFAKLFSTSRVVRHPCNATTAKGVHVKCSFRIEFSGEAVMKVPLTPLRCLHRAIDLYGHKEAIVCGEKRFTYAEFGERCERLASALTMAGSPARRPRRVSQLQHAPPAGRLFRRAAGPRHGDAAQRPAHARRAEHDSEALRSREDSFLRNDFAPLVQHLLKAWPSCGPSISIPSTRTFIAAGQARARRHFSYDEDAIASLFYTSGSTGTPKGVMLSHRTVYMHAMAVAGVFNARR
jgi:hypothetical protein